MSDQTLPDAAPTAAGHQMFRLVDAQKLGASGGGCGCGGHGHAAVAERADEGGTATAGGCGCGGHGHRAAPGQDAAAQEKASGGCGCGGHGQGGHHHGGAHAAAAPTAPGVGAAEELVVHSIPRVVRKAVLFAAVDGLPVGDGIVLVAPHQPEPLFEHLRDSASHYRVETLDAGPQTWRYRVTRLS